MSRIKRKLKPRNCSCRVGGSMEETAQVWGTAFLDWSPLEVTSLCSSFGIEDTWYCGGEAVVVTVEGPALFGKPRPTLYIWRELCSNTHYYSCGQKISLTFVWQRICATIGAWKLSDFEMFHLYHREVKKRKLLGWFWLIPELSIL